MLTTRNIVRVFLASPGDLEEERRAIRDAVIEFNATWADPLGYQIELTDGKRLSLGMDDLNTS